MTTSIAFNSSQNYLSDDNYVHNYVDTRFCDLVEIQRFIL